MVFLRKQYIVAICILCTLMCRAFDFTPVRIKYEGGDWYNDPNALKILAEYINENTSIQMDTTEYILRLKDRDIHDHPFLFITGHGDFLYNDRDLENIREYITNGGFVYIDDDYGFNRGIMSFLTDLFPDNQPRIVYDDNDIFSCCFYMPYMPKIHEHYKGDPETYGIFINSKISILYTFNTNISDGWSTAELHNDPPIKKEAALKMGSNIIYYALFK